MYSHVCIILNTCHPIAGGNRSIVVKQDTPRIARINCDISIHTIQKSLLYAFGGIGKLAFYTPDRGILSRMYMP
jgi:hypothetical protein